MDWYERLNEYFPEHEMKDPLQMKELIEEKDVYHKEETEDYLIMYAEFPLFVFIDYLLVNPHRRGRGTGTIILNRFKEKGKTILLEVEPKDPYDEDTVKRVAFYAKNGFKKADLIEYERKNDEGDSYKMNILYWTPETISQTEVMEQMVIACEEIHNFRAKKYYDRIPADPDVVLNWKQ